MFNRWFGKKNTGQIPMYSDLRQRPTRPLPAALLEREQHPDERTQREEIQQQISEQLQSSDPDQPILSELLSAEGGVVTIPLPEKGVHLRGAQRAFTKTMLQHACAEAGHDQLALNDLQALGANIATLPFERPAPETAALIGFSFYLIQYLNPVSYLGFVFHLEYLATHSGARYAQGLLKAGVPPNALTFLGEHVEADVGHNRLMAEYVEHLLVTERDVEDVIYAMRVTANLYAKVFEAAFRSVDEGATYDYGVNRAELAPGVNHSFGQRLAA